MIEPQDEIIIKEMIDKALTGKISQLMIPSGTIKQRHVEGDIIFEGLSADLPDGSNEVRSYFETDTGILKKWNGSAWINPADNPTTPYVPPTTTNLSQAINRQDNTTNSVVSNQSVQFGWGWITGDGVNRQQTEAVTFPVAFDVAPIVICAFCGHKATTDPADITELSVINSTVAGTGYAITTSGFTALIRRVSNDGNDPGVLSTVNRYGYAWVAIGTKSR